MRSLVFYGVHAVLLGMGAWLLCGPNARHMALSGRKGLIAWLGLAACTYAISEPQGAMWQDFIDAYYAGGRAALSGRAEVVALLTEGVHGFVNLPVVAYLFVPFGVLKPRLAALVFTLLGVFATLLALRVTARAARLPERETRVLGLLFALNGPLFNSLREGNTTHFALLAVALAMLALRERREWTAGALIGAAAVLKLPLLLFGGYFILRGRLRAVAGGAAALLAVGLSSLLVFGWDVHLTWYQTFVAGAGDRPIGAFNVQSVAALIARLERGGAALFDWNGQALSPAGRIAAKAMSGAVVALTLFVCVRDRRELASRAHLQARAQELEYLIVLVLACALSPLSWSHYFALLLLPMAFALSPRSALANTGATERLALVSIALLSLPVVWPPDLLGRAGAFSALLRLGLSHFVFGEFLLFALLLRARARVTRDPGALTTERQPSAEPVRASA